MVDYDDWDDGAQRCAYDSPVCHGESPTPGTAGSLRAHRHIPDGIPDDMGWVCYRGPGGQLGLARKFTAVVHDGGKHQRLSGRRSSHNSRSVPVEPSQIRLPKPLPLPHVFLDERLERRRTRRTNDGSTSWDILRRLLLGVDGPALCVGGDEPGVDRDSGSLRTSGEGSASGATGQ